MDSIDLEQVALVASLQRQAGGNTAEVLDVVVDGIRERFKLRRLVQGAHRPGTNRPLDSDRAADRRRGLDRRSSIRGYLSPLFTRPRGQIMIVMAVVMVTAGSFVIKRITSIEL